MCTVTFLARARGYCLGMNRDEKLTRAPGLPPRRRRVNGRVVLCPSEPGGGTWIAVNDRGATLALVNWYSVAARVHGPATSRGGVVRALSGAESPGAAEAGLAELPLNRINPFRLIGVYPETREVLEWRWDLRRLVRKKHPWKARQWISSGFDEPVAQRARGKIFQQARRQRSAGGREWLRRLHRSHAPHPGPFSTCMHRDDAATVSYTEITASGSQAAMLHHPGPPCQPGPHRRLRLHLRRRKKLSTSSPAW